MPPKTRYVTNNGVSIAYQVCGDGPIDLVVVPGFVSHLELEWTSPWMADYLRGLMSFCRLIRFDKRGTGLSDPVPGVPTLEDRMEDVRAVMDAAGIERAALLGLSEGGPMAALFAATYPARVSALVLYGAFAAGGAPPEEGGITAENYPKVLELIDDWGEGRIIEMFAPSLDGEQSTRTMIGTYERSAASPGMARALVDAATQIDVRDVLPTIQAPTLVMHRTHELIVPVAAARYMASSIPGARLVEFPGKDHMPWIDPHPLLREIESFLTGASHVHEPDRVLATILFTDIVGSTDKAAELGDARWRELLERHERIVRAEVQSYRGRVIKLMGDGVLAAFDGPARAIRCAAGLRDRVREELGVELTSGVHTGECESMGDDLGGMAVHIGARVAAKARPGEVLVSGTVKDLVVGSGLAFEDAGEHELKGVPGRWRLHRLAAATGARVAPLQPAAANMTATDRAIGRIARRAPGALRTLSRLTIKEKAAD